MTLLFVGIDPGLDGAVAALDEKGAVVGVCDTPVFQAGARRDYVTTEMGHVILLACGFRLGTPGPDVRIKVAIERGGTRPGQSAQSGFSFGRGCGLWEGVVAAKGLAYELVLPQRWKKAMLAGYSQEAKDKKALAVARAKALFPTAEITLKKHSGRAEALLMAEYLRRVMVADDPRKIGGGNSE